MQTIDLNAELERLHEKFMHSDDKGVHRDILMITDKLYAEAFQTKIDFSGFSDEQLMKEIDDLAGQETERAAPAIKEMIEKEKEIDWAREFEALLCGMNCWGKYKAAYSSSRMIHNPDKVADFLARAKPDRYVASAFGWHKTIQGDDFWYHVSDKWQRKILELKGFKND